MERINELFFSKDRADGFIKSTLATFPPHIFGTVLRKRRSRCGQYVEVNGSRFTK